VIFAPEQSPIPLLIVPLKRKKHISQCNDYELDRNYLIANIRDLPVYS
jgi:hypothetical protein